jgi:predicted dehydrogenase
MRFALLGNHPDGLALAQALVDSGRHTLTAVSAVTGRLVGTEARSVSDLEELLADPAVEAVIVAGPPAMRGAQLRRALQSERPVLCVHPVDEKPDLAYEAAIIQSDTRQLLLPILPEALHPAFRRLREFLDREGVTSPIGAFLLLIVDRQTTGEVLLNTSAGLELAVPGWEILRVIGGEIVELSSFADTEALEAGAAILLAGRFEKGGLFQVTMLPNQPQARWRMVIIGSKGQAELIFPQGWDGPSFLTWAGGPEETWPRFDAWPEMVAVLEAAVAEKPTVFTWQDEVRLLELDDAARRSVEKRRAHIMEYQEASEEVGFKGTMALAGCGLLWSVLLLLIVSRWFPWVGWMILPLLLVFIALQFLRYAIPGKGSSG